MSAERLSTVKELHDLAVAQLNEQISEVTKEKDDLEQKINQRKKKKEFTRFLQQSPKKEEKLDLIQPLLRF